MHNQYPINQETSDLGELYSHAASLADKLWLSMGDRIQTLSNDRVMCATACTRSEYLRDFPLSTIAIHCPLDLLWLPSQGSQILYESRVPDKYDNVQKFVIGVDSEGCTYVDASKVHDQSNISDTINRSDIGNEEEHAQMVHRAFEIAAAESSLTLERADIDSVRKLIELLSNGLNGGVFSNEDDGDPLADVLERNSVSRAREASRRIVAMFSRRS